MSDHQTTESAGRFTGHDGRRCGRHHTTGGRAWCLDCTEWCSEEIPCQGCELPGLYRRERPEPVGDTCQLVEVDGEPVRILGAPTMTAQERGYLAEIVGAARRRYAADAGPRTDLTELREVLNHAHDQTGDTQR